MFRTLCIAAAFISAAGAAQAQPKVGDTLACTSKDPAKRLFAVVGLIEPFGNGDMVANVTLLNEQPGAPVPAMAHIPIQLKVLEAGCQTTAAAPRPLAPQFESGRQQWLEATRTQHAGIFTITVDQIDDFIRQTIAQEAVGKAAQ